MKKFAGEPLAPGQILLFYISPTNPPPSQVLIKNEVVEKYAKIQSQILKSGQRPTKWVSPRSGDALVRLERRCLALVSETKNHNKWQYLCTKIKEMKIKSFKNETNNLVGKNPRNIFRE